VFLSSAAFEKLENEMKRIFSDAVVTFQKYFRAQAAKNLYEIRY
jgi:hypothetical protein